MISVIGRALLVYLSLLVSTTLYALPPEEIERWTEDLAHYQQQLQKRHINLYHHITEASFRAEIDKLRQALPTLNREQVRVNLMRISRLIGDGHTQLAFWENEHHYYPFGLTMVGREVRVTRTTDAAKQLLGTTLHSINGVRASKVIEKLAPVVQGVENEHSLNAKIGWHAGQAEVLFGLGITAKPDTTTYRFVTDAGEQLVITVNAKSMDDFYEAVTQRLVSTSVPIGSKVLSQSESLWLAIEQNQRIAYLYFAAYPSFSEMESFATDLRQQLTKHGIRDLIIDLRQNTGGDFFVGLRLAHQLVLVDTLDWDHGIYTLIGNRTFSAGMSNAAHFRQMLNAKLVGEPTGGNPVGYQDMDQFVLPHSKFVITYSKRNYRFQDNATQGIQPDVLIRTDWDSYKRGDDKAMKWILADIASRNAN